MTVIRPPFIRAPILDYAPSSHRNEIEKQIRESAPDVIVGFGILNANMAIRLAKAWYPFFYYIIGTSSTRPREASPGLLGLWSPGIWRRPTW